MQYFCLENIKNIDVSSVMLLLKSTGFEYIWNYFEIRFKHACSFDPSSRLTFLVNTTFLYDNVATLKLNL